MSRACAASSEEGRCIQELLGKPEGKRPLVKSKYRTNDTKIDPREMGWDDSSD
jgi:hypothetical protein